MALGLLHAESVIHLGGAQPSAELFPRGALARAFTSAVDEGDRGEPAWPGGHEDLRAWIAARLWARG